MRENINLGLTGLDDIFSTQEEREDAKLAKIREIPLTLIDDFPDHPFRVRDDDDMQSLVESIRTRGIITPVMLRPKEDGRYEMVSGHRRKRACEILGFTAIKAEVRELSRDEAVILMVESNLQRSLILPSEKAFSYKMRLEAMNRQGKRTDLTLSPMGTKLGRSSNEITAETGDSKNQIYRYIRLTYLNPDLLKLVDTAKIALRPAVELSYLTPGEQSMLYDEIEAVEAMPSLAQAIKLRKFSAEGRLSGDVIDSIMTEEKPNQREKIRIDYCDARKFIPDNIPYGKETENYVMRALEYYAAALEKERQRRGRER